jgi:hypothetical protein
MTFLKFSVSVLLRLLIFILFKGMFYFSVIPGHTVKIKIILIENSKYLQRAFSIKFVVHPFFSHMKLAQFVTGSF